MNATPRLERAAARAASQPTRFLVRTVEKHPRYCRMGPDGAAHWTRAAFDATQFSRADARWAYREASNAGLSVTIQAYSP